MKIELKNWDTAFFNRNIYSILFEKDETQNLNNFLQKLEVLKEDLLKAGNGLYELVLESNCFHLFGQLEDFGFRLVDSKFKFITELKKSNLPPCNYELPENYSIRKYEEKFYEDVQELCNDYLINDSQVVTRYKSLFYTKEECIKYYSTWIKNSLNDKDSFCSILVNEELDKSEGFFIYKKNLQNDKSWYKGILVSVHPKLRGRNLHLGLQEFQFNNFEEETFYIENATQLSNLPIIKNHFLSNRTPKSIEFTFLLDIK